MRPLDGRHGAGIGAGHAAERVVQVGAGEVETERHLIEAGGLQLAHQVLTQRRAGGGNGAHAQPQPLAMANQAEQVGPLHRIAAAENEHRRAHRRHVGQQRLALGGAELVGVAARLCRRAAVRAGEVARLRGFPDDQEGGAGEVDGQAGVQAARRRQTRTCSFSRVRARGTPCVSQPRSL